VEAKLERPMMFVIGDFACYGASGTPALCISAISRALFPRLGIFATLFKVKCPAHSFPIGGLQAFADEPFRHIWITPSLSFLSLSFPFGWLIGSIVAIGWRR
jgi:hypothetical protein